jgi:adenylosuccinate synthase
VKHGKFNTIVDSAWGSSAKGAASCRLAEIHGVQNLSSGNFPNAGHTCIKGDEKFVAKALPTGAILKKLGILQPTLWIGPNSGFELAQFEKELGQTGYTPGQDLLIHERAMIVEQRHIDAEAPAGSKSTLHISSTMSGSGAAFTDKAMRTKEARVAGSTLPALSPNAFWQETQSRMFGGESFLHEVSQGFALSINYGTHYPHCTFRDCTPQQAYADFGVTKDFIGDVYLNVRSFPIRVGNNYDGSGQQIGYSGDCLSDQQELTWEQIALAAEMPAEEVAALAERERTTVTKKIRRAFTPSWDLLRYSAQFCGATKLILNFPQYIHWSAFKVRGGPEALLTLHPKVREYIDRMEEETNLPVVMVGTGADHDDYIYLDEGASAVASTRLVAVGEGK